MEIIIRMKLISMSIISTSQTVPGQHSPRFHVEAWLPFWNREMTIVPSLRKTGSILLVLDTDFVSNGVQNFPGSMPLVPPVNCSFQLQRQSFLLAV